MFVQTTPKFVGFTLTVSFFLLVSFSALAQNEVAIGSATTKPNAILWLNGNGSQGLLLPVVTNKSAVSNPEKGMFIYDDSDSKVWYWNSSAWVEAGGSGTGSGTVTTVTGTSPVVVTNPNTTPEISLADGGITNAKLANDAITSAKIQDATITGSDISNTTISVDKLAQSGALSGQVLKWNGTNWVPQNDDAGVGSVPTLSNGQLLIGNGTTNSAAVVSGDATLSGGVLTITNGVISGGTGGKITDGSITNADIASAAGIDVTKLAIGTNGQVLTTIAGVPTWSAGSAGTVTSVAAGTGLTGGPITSTGTLSVDVGTTANKIVQLDGTARLPAIDGSQLSGLNASNISAGLLPLSRITAGAAGEVLTTVAGVPAWQAPVTGVTTLDGLTDAAIAAPASGQVLVNDGAGQFRNVNMSGDAGISAAGALTIANGAISGGVGGKIADATITAADLAAGSVSGGAAGIITDATITNADISGSAAIAVTKVAAGANGNVLTTVLGVPTWQAPAAGSDAQDLTIAGTTLSLVNDPTPVVLGGLSILNSVTTAEITNGTIAAVDLAPGSVSGGVGGVIADGTITTADITDGTVVTADIADGTVTNADISGVAAIAVTKVAAGANGNVLTTVLGVPTWQAPAAGADAQDLTIAGTTLSLVNDPTPVVLGGLSILNSVTTAEITNGTVAAVDLAPGSVSGGAGGVITDGTITTDDITDGTVATADIADGTVTNSDISGAAAIAVTKVAAGANGNVLTTVAGVPTWQAPVTGATTLDGLTDATVAAPASGQILVNNGAGQFVNVSMSGDATISNTGALTIANGAISGGVGGKITDATIVAADLAAGSVSGGAGGVITDASITSADLAAGSVSGGAGGILTDATVTNADISGSAAIAVTKVAAGANGDVLTTLAGVPTWQAPVTGATTLDGLTDATVAAPASGQILVNNGAGQFVNVNMSGDATISNTGALTIANGAISGGVGGKITDATIVAADLAAGSVSGGAGGILTDATITNADISGSAAIAVAKVAAGANGNVLTTLAGVPTWAAPAGGFSTLDNVPKGDGTTLVASSIYDVGGLVGINNSGPLHNLDVYGSLFQTYGDTYFNQSLDNTNGNMAIGGVLYSNIKLNVESDQDYGLYVLNPSGYAAAYFEGYVGVNGDMDVLGAMSKGSGTFKIDHPLDPQNKILYHSFVESPDMMNVYNGNVVTDGQGEVTVSLPDYFEALNKDFRYQLTVMGTFAQAIVYKKIANNRFVIKTDKPDVEVSWQVTGIRKDPYAEKNRVVPEVAKTGDQIGKYLYPEAYGVASKTGNSAQGRLNPPAKQKAPEKKATTQKAPLQKQ